MFDYYYGNEAEQFTFLRVPKFLFSDSTFSELSSDAKIMYSLMLDRMGLSVKNGWLDDQNRVYIIFTHEEAQRSMNCGGDKCTKLFKELEDIGLISRKKRGMGRPALIFVKNFVHELEQEDNTADMTDSELAEKENSEVKTSENQKSRLRKSRSQDFGKSEVKTSEKSESRLRENRSQDFGKTVVNKTDNIKTDVDLDQSYQSIVPQDEFNEMDRIDFNSKDKNYWLDIIKENISYNVFVSQNNDAAMSITDEIVRIMVDVMCGLRKIYISGQAVPRELAKSRLMLLRYEHIAYVIDSISSTANTIAKPDAYICTSLYNAACTLNVTTFAGFSSKMGIPLMKT